MKDILIVARSNDNRDLAPSKTITKVAKESEVELSHPFDNTWLLSGPKSFSTASKLLAIAESENLPVVVFEIENVLQTYFPPEKDNPE